MQNYASKSSNITDAVLNSIDTKTKQNENFLLINEEKKNLIILFSCETQS